MKQTKKYTFHNVLGPTLIMKTLQVKQEFYLGPGLAGASRATVSGTAPVGGADLKLRLGSLPRVSGIKVQVGRCATHTGQQQGGQKARHVQEEGRQKLGF